MQIALEDHVDDLLVAGVADMRPHAMPARFDAALDACRPLVAGDEAAMFEDVRALRPRYVAWCEQLHDAAIRPSLDHSDLHTNNILLANPQDRATARVYDWGDSVVAHPFSSMLVLLRQVSDALGATVGDPRLARIRDAYLAPYAAVLPGTDVSALMETACRVAIVMRATTWLRVLELGPPPDPAYATAPWDWMKTLLQDSWLS
jgi:aminoglycoside phosphotransferase (APT) family kinase protein